MNPHTSHPARRFFQFSLRQTLALLAAIAVLLGLTVPRLRQNYSECARYGRAGSFARFA